VNPFNILSEADRCVKCGLCLPHCPTYQLSKDEGESPRGRIALIQGLATGELTDTSTLNHLNRCLTCRNCEAACPSGVKYARLIDAAREMIRQRQGKRAINRLEWLTRLPYRPLSHTLLGLYQRSGLRTIARGVGGRRFRQRDDLLPHAVSGQQWAERYTPQGPPGWRVGLFLGCVSQITDQPALQAAIRVLNRLGVEVVIPPGQNCCGAMHQHNGESAMANQLASGNRCAFSQYKLDAIIGLASGCTAQLLEYALLEQEFDAPVMDISRFINRFIRKEQLDLRPLAKPVALHTPCTERNALKSAGEPRKLLRQIPEIQLSTLPDNGCCGAAGTHLLTHQGLADELRSPLLDHLEEQTPEILLTSNSGCAMHLRAGIKQRGLRIKVQHPIELLAEQLHAHDLELSPVID